MKKQQNILLSAIIPVYNTAPYLRKCVDSVRKQTYKYIEIILVDDGSTDGSAKICDEYLEIDKRVVVFHKKNEGPFLARKYGIESAHGKFVTFIDSDDWIEEDSFETLMRLGDGQDVDLILSGLWIENDGKSSKLIDSIEEGVYFEEQIRKVILPKMVFDEQKSMAGVNASMCNKLFRIEILLKMLGTSAIALTLGEDGAVVYPFLAYSKKIVVSHYCGYHYVQRNDSGIHNLTMDSFNKIYQLQCYLLQEFESLGLKELVQNQIVQYVSSFLNAIIKKVYGIHADSLYCLPPYEKIPIGSRIVLYGAGNVGRAYMRAFKFSNYANVIAWLDRDCSLQEKFIDIMPPEYIEKVDFDYVLVAVENKTKALEIIDYLLKQKISREKIVWESVKAVPMFSFWESK